MREQDRIIRPQRLEYMSFTTFIITSPPPAFIDGM
jgi:hypothetical protein